MIRVNGEFYKDHAIIDDKIVFDIHTEREELSSLTPDAILKGIYSGDLPFNLEGLSIKAYKLKKNEMDEDFEIGVQQEYKPARKVLTDEDITNFEDVFTVKDREKSLRSEYDKFDRKYVNHEDSFIETDINEDELRTQIMDSLGVVPTLFNEDDLNISEKIKYSNAARGIMWPDFVMESFSIDENPYPNREDIEFYMNNLNTYEKRLVRSTNINPLSLIQDIRDLRALNSREVFTKQMYDAIISSVQSAWFGNDPLQQRPSAERLYNLSRMAINEASEDYRYAQEQFTARLTRAPRVLPEIMSAMYKAAGSNSIQKQAIDEYIDFYAKAQDGKEKNPRDAGRAFQQSLGKIAGRHNPGLFAAAKYMNFANISEDIIDLLAVYLSPEKARIFGEAGFFNWYKDHPELTAAEMIEVLSALDYTIDEYSGNHARSMSSEISADALKKVFESDGSATNTVDGVLYKFGQLKGKMDAASFENDNSRFHFADNDIAIKGREIQATDGKYTILMLPADDYRNFTVGYDTCCCQHYGSAGESCVLKLASDPYAAQVVIVRNSQMKDGKWYKGPCLAQAFVWTDEARSTIVFDNMEFRRTTEENFDHRIKEFSNIIATWAEAMPYLNVHVGVGCNQGMAGWGKRAAFLASMPDTVHAGDSYTYSDYHSDAKSIKTGGEVELTRVEDGSILQVIHTPVVPSQYDLFQDERLSWLASANVRNDAKFDLADKFLTDQTEEVQRQAFRINPECIKYIEHPILDIQNEVAAHHKELVSYIHNPDPSIYNVLIQNDPYSIFTIENPTHDAWKAAVKGNGLLLEKCPYPDEDIKLEAVKQNGIAIKFIKSPSFELQDAALHQTINAISFIHEPDTRAILYACTINPSLIQNLKDIPVSTQRAIVEAKPSAFMYLKNPSDAATMAALSHDGMMIRNVRNQTKDICLAAVRQNGFAIKYIYHPDRDVIKEALRQNRAASKYIKISNEDKQSLLDELDHDMDR